MQFFGLTISRSKAAAPVPVRTGGFLGIVRESFAGAWQRNVVVDSREALLAFSAVYACVNRIASDIAKLRIRLVELTGDGIWVEVSDRASPFWPVLRRPNHYQNRIQFVVSWLVSKLLRGNAYIFKVRDGRGVVVRLYVLDPARVTPLVTPEGDVYYQVAIDQLSRLGSAVTVPASEVIHDRAMTPFHPLIGVSPVYAYGASATQGNRIQANSARFFENMSRPSGMLTAPGTIDAITAARLKEEWQNNYGGGNLGKTFVGGDGLKYEAMTIPASDAQLIEQLKWTVEDVARAHSMPLYKIGAGQMPTNNNVEALQQQYYDDCLQIHIESIELLLDEAMGIGEANNSTLGTEFDLVGLMRMDTAAQYDAIGKAIQGRWMSPNEGRLKANLPPVTGGESPLAQHQDYSLAALAKRDAMANPFDPAGTAAPPPAPPAAELAPATDTASGEAKVFALFDKMKKEFDVEHA
jgi:HK97 family phage portal protein